MERGEGEVKVRCGVGGMRDRGHDKWTLSHFMEQEPAIVGQLTRAEVAALRLYTMSTFRVINGPLRANFMPRLMACRKLQLSPAPSDSIAKCTLAVHWCTFIQLSVRMK